MGLTKVTYSMIDGAFVNVLDYGADPTGTNDSTAAFKAARDYAASLTGSDSYNTTFSGRGIKVFIPNGTYLISEEIAWGGTAVYVEGEGANTTVVKAAVSFTGSAVFTFGVFSTITYTRSQGCQGIGFNLNNNSIPAIRFAGLRNGSYFKDITITAFTGTAFLSDWSGTVGSYTMSQGVLIENVYAINVTNNLTNVSVFSLDGLYETTLINCEYIGAGSIQSSGVVGFHVGASTTGRSCRGINFIGCSAGNITQSVLDDSSCGIKIENAEYIFTKGCTFELIDGYSIVMGSATSSPTYCRSDYDRFYSPGTTKYTKSVYIYSGQFNTAALAISQNTTANYLKIGSSALHSNIEVISNRTFANLSASYSLAGSTNKIYGVAAGQSFVINGESNNAVIQQGGLIGNSRIYLENNTAQTAFVIPDMTSTDNILLAISSGLGQGTGLIQCLAGGSITPTVVAAGTLIETSTAALNGTTGTVGKITIAVNSANPQNVVIENRSGYNIYLSVTAFGAIS